MRCRDSAVADGWALCRDLARVTRPLAVCACLFTVFYLNVRPSTGTQHISKITVASSVKVHLSYIQYSHPPKIPNPTISKYPVQCWTSKYSASTNTLQRAELTTAPAVTPAPCPTRSAPEALRNHSALLQNHYAYCGLGFRCHKVWG